MISINYKDEIIVKNVDFKEIKELLEKEKLYIGIISSLNKKLLTNDFRINKIKNISLFVNNNENISKIRKLSDDENYLIGTYRTKGSEEFYVFSEDFTKSNNKYNILSSTLTNGDIITLNNGKYSANIAGDYNIKIVFTSLNSFEKMFQNNEH